MDESWFEERYHLKCKVIEKQDAEIARLRGALTELLWCAEELQETDCDRFIDAKQSARQALDEQIGDHGPDKNGRCRSCGRSFAPPVSQCPTCAEPLKFAETDSEYRQRAWRDWNGLYNR
jgi:hypothetical protein